MNPPRSEGFVRMPDAEFEAILTRAAEEGAKRALARSQKGAFMKYSVSREYERGPLLSRVEINLNGAKS